MSGRYLYCQNTSCGTYLGCSGGDSCSICGWNAGRYMGDDDCEESDELGCLAFTRKHGQAFWVGDTTKITSYMTPKRSEVRLEILDGETLSPRLLRQGEQLLLRDDVMIEVITDHKRGAHVKFKIIAPKALKVQRAELREKDLHSVN